MGLYPPGADPWMPRAPFRGHRLALRFHRCLDATIQQGAKPGAGAGCPSFSLETRDPGGRWTQLQKGQCWIVSQAFFTCRRNKKRKKTVRQTIKFFFPSISNSFTRFISQILLFANFQNNIGRKKISNNLRNFILKNPKPANETKRPAKRTDSSAKRTKSPAKHEEKDRCQAWNPRVYLPTRQGDMPSEKRWGISMSGFSSIC